MKKQVQQLSDNFEELKKFMDCCINVHHWNEKREIAKGYFLGTLISQLDGSGFITQAIKPVDFEEINAVL